VASGATGNYRTALYSDSGVPSTLLGQSADTAISGTGWNDAAVTGITITVSSNYWACFQGQSGTPHYYYKSTISNTLSALYVQSYGVFPTGVSWTNPVNYVYYLRMTYGTGSTVVITFAVSGIQGSDLSPTAPVLWIDGTPVTYNNFFPSGSPFLTWVIGSTHSISAGSQLLGSSYTYTFSSWTNGDGLGSSPSGTYTVPASPTTLTENFAATPISGGGVPVTFQINYVGPNAPPTFTVDPEVMLVNSGSSNDYYASQFPITKSFPAGSSQTLRIAGQLGPSNNYWLYTGCILSSPFFCQGSGSGGAFVQTWPSSSATMTLTYVQKSIITFNTIGLGADVPTSTNLIKIDGTDYTIATLAAAVFLFTTASGHTLQTYSPLSGTSTYTFHTYVNGGSCTTSASCTYIVPAGLNTVSIKFGAGNIVAVTFALSGFVSSGYLSDYLTMFVNSTAYTYNFPIYTKILYFGAGSFSAISVPASVIDPLYTFTFLSWTNGHGLVGPSGTFTAPATNGTTTTANYNAVHVVSGIYVTFTQSGLGSDVNSTTRVIGVDNGNGVWTYYRKTDLPVSISDTSNSIRHIVAITPIHGTSHDYGWTSWTNGIGTDMGTLIWPTANVTVTANYGTVSVVTTTFPFTIMTLTRNVSMTLSVTSSAVSTHTSIAVSIPSSIPPVEVPLLQAIIWVGLCIATWGGMGYVSSRGQGEGALVGVSIGTGVGVIIMVIFFQFPLYLLLLGALALVGAIWVRRG
jgi:hypothetical protein